MLLVIYVDLLVGVCIGWFVIEDVIGFIVGLKVDIIGGIFVGNDVQFILGDIDALFVYVVGINVSNVTPNDGEWLRDIVEFDDDIFAS